MPEYQFFHNLSNQGIMSLEDYNKIFKLTKLKLKKKILFDNINLNLCSSVTELLVHFDYLLPHKHEL